jgi:glyoxylase-like metal-dependent hydrolase (beta-lactamase superfamily II)
MSLIETFRVGDLTCHTIDAGGFRLDGGAMFGVVPKPLWERRTAADDRNRIQMTMRCVLIDHPDGPVLIDTGAGNKEPAKFRDIYSLENQGAAGRTRLEDGLAELGVRPEEVTWVINTHLHFDHAGGNTFVEAPDGAPRIAFPNARHVVQRGELEFGGRPNERIAASYLTRNYDAVTQAGAWTLLEGPAQVLPGIRALHTPGHTPHHQSIVIEDRGEVACFLADLIPTTAHLPLPWIMGYDLEPLVTLESKRELLAMAWEEQWLLIFEHDAHTGMGRLAGDGKKYELVPAEG